MGQIARKRFGAGEIKVLGVVKKTAIAAIFRLAVVPEWNMITSGNVAEFGKNFRAVGDQIEHFAILRRINQNKGNLVALAGLNQLLEDLDTLVRDPEPNPMRVAGLKTVKIAVPSPMRRIKAVDQIFTRIHSGQGA